MAFPATNLGLAVELALAADGVNHRRRVTNFLRGQRAPNLFARLFVQGDDHAIRAAHQTNQAIAVEQRMRGPTPHRRLGVEARDEIHGPNQFAAGRFEATQVAHRAECEHPPARSDGRGARSSRIINAVRTIVAGLPKLLAGAGVQAKHALVARNLRNRTVTGFALRRFARHAIEQKNSLPFDRRSAIAAIDRHAPKHFGSTRGKFFDNSILAPDAIAFWSEPLRPIVAAEVAGNAGQKNQCGCGPAGRGTWQDLKWAKAVDHNLQPAKPARTETSGIAG